MQQKKMYEKTNLGNKVKRKNKSNGKMESGECLCVRTFKEKKLYQTPCKGERESLKKKKKKNYAEIGYTHIHTHYKIDKYGKPNYNSILVSIFNFHPILRHVQCRPEWQSEFVRKRWFQMMNANEFTVDPEDVCMK